MKNTYFFISYQVDKETYECGPYPSLLIATEMFVDHIPFLASSQAQKQKYIFKSEIQERTFDLENNIWSTISTLLTENSCRKQKLRHTIKRTSKLQNSTRE